MILQEKDTKKVDANDTENNKKERSLKVDEKECTKDESGREFLLERFEYKQVKKCATNTSDVKAIIDHLKEGNLNCNLITPLSSLVKPSPCFSAITSADKTGFFINVVPFSHFFDPLKSQFHRFQVLKVWVPPNCYIIFNAMLLHGGSTVSAPKVTLKLCLTGLLSIKHSPSSTGPLKVGL